MSDSRNITVAAFDFDGTLTRRDSLLPFLSHFSGMFRFAMGMLRMSPVLSAYAIGYLQNDVAKEKVLKYFLGGCELSEIEVQGEIFAHAILPKLQCPIAMKRLEWHKNQGHLCILVSASLAHYLDPWAKNAGFDHVLASRLDVDSDGRITGKLVGGNCFGEQKAKRIKAYLTDQGEYSLYAYGDSRGDKEMLEMADFAYYKTMPTDGVE